MPELRIVLFNAVELNSRSAKKFRDSAECADRLTIFVPRSWRHYDAARRSLHVLEGNPDRRGIFEGFRDGMATRILAACWILVVEHHNYDWERQEDSGGITLTFSRRAADL